MKRPDRSDEEALRGDRGVVLPLVALLSAVFIGLVAMAVDLGWLYLNSNRVQNAADAAALAGVPYMPPDGVFGPGEQSYDTALALAASNDFVNGIDGAVVTPRQVFDAAGQPLNFQLKVTIQKDVRTFFLPLFGLNEVRITKTATAEALPPLRIGGRTNVLGHAHEPLVTGEKQGFWLGINAELSEIGRGDPFNSECVTASVGANGEVNGCSVTNPLYGERLAQGIDGYYYAIDVPEGTPVGANLKVEIFDGPHNNRDLNPHPGLNPAPDDFMFPEGCVAPCSGGIPSSSIEYQLYAADNTPFRVTDNAAIAGCRQEYIGAANPPEFTGWRTLCEVAVSRSGIYPLQVSTGSGGSGHNDFSIRATLAGSPDPDVYAIGDMSIYANVTGGTAVFDLVKVTSDYAGKQVKVSFFDAGDASGDSFIEFKPDSGSVTCSYTTPGGSTFTNVSPCKIQTTFSGSSPYNGKWLDVTFAVPSNYTCATDCWWQVQYQVPAGASTFDRTTWAAEVAGNPFHLII